MWCWWAVKRSSLDYNTWHSFFSFPTVKPIGKIFFYVGLPKEDIFFDHLLWSIFQSMGTYILQITFQLWASEGSFHVLHLLLCLFDMLWALLFAVFSVLARFKFSISEVIYYVETGTFWNSKWKRKIRFENLFWKCMCWRWWHNVLETKWSKSGVKR